MRTLAPWLVTLGLTACSGTSAPPASDPTPVADSSPEVPAPVAGADPAEAPAEVVRPALTPIPPATPVPEPRDIALVGYGLRIALNPPFQAMRMGAWLGDAGKETVVVSWWDVNAEGAGAIGYAGLYNTTLVPGTEQAPGSEFSLTTEDTKESRKSVLTLGAGGTAVQLQEGHSALGGCGTISQAPYTEGWVVELDGKAVEWPVGPMLHSTDPASGAPFDFLERPQQPWGPWPAGLGGAKANAAAPAP